MTTPLDDKDRAILDRIQRDFPLTGRPFLALGERVGLSEEETLARIHRMQQDGVIRRIGPVFDLHRLGFVSTLCAARCAPDRLEEAAQFVNGFSEVTHNYERDHEWNLWFTLIAPDAERIDAILNAVQRHPGVCAVHSLPATRTFKIAVHFRTKPEKGK